jgi:hypothetical protein
MSINMPLDCDGFAIALADYLDGDSSDAVRAAVESHAAECAACRQLLEDLVTIRHDAAALPALTPSRDLWDGIAERIDAKVLPLEVGERSVQRSRRWWTSPAVAAAALVIVTAGITHFATRATLTKSAARDSAVAPERVVTTAPISEATTPARATARTPLSTGEGEYHSTSTDRGSARPRAAVPSSATAPAARLVSAEPLMKATEPVYDREILKLRAIVKTRRSQLDPKTVAVLEQSIAVIDSAIAQSRSALAKDPASGFLATQLNHSLEKKVELLRTAALLPART